MSRLEELLQRLCPKGVPYKSVSDIADTFIGLATSVTKYKVNDGVMLLHNSDIKDGRIEVKKYEYLNESFVEKNSKKILRKNDVITVHTGDVGTSAVISEEYDGTIGFTTISSRIKNYAEITPEFLCKYLNSNLCKSQIVSKTISDRNNLNLASFDKLIVPIPPLEVQEEIVRILDEYTEKTNELIENLTAELTARKKQYEYYRNKMLSFGDNIKSVKLSNVCNVYDGTHQTPNYTETGIKFASVENIQMPYNTKKHISVEDYKKYKIKPQIGDVLMTRIGSIGVCYVIDRHDDLAYYVSLALLRPDTTSIDSRYLKHYLESIQGTKELRKRTLVNAVPIKINKDDIGKISIKLPPLEEQRRIASILDRFETLCNDISAGLPAEIEARQKQYEYYRDKLLTFKEMS